MVQLDLNDPDSKYQLYRSFAWTCCRRSSDCVVAASSIYILYDQQHLIALKCLFFVYFSLLLALVFFFLVLTFLCLEFCFFFVSVWFCFQFLLHC